MSHELYRPATGQTLFASLYDNHPKLITVTRVFVDTNSNREVVEFTDREGRHRSNALKVVTFYPGADPKSKYLYVVETHEHEYMGGTEVIEQGCFFTPEDAFAHMDALESGQASHKVKPSQEFVQYYVSVIRI